MRRRRPKSKQRQAREHNDGTGVRLWIFPLAIFGLALLVRLIYLLQYRTNPFFDFPIIDSATYDRIAWNYARGLPLWDDAFWQPPLYPWFLGIVYRALGHTLFGARLAQICIGSLSCALLYAIGRRVFGRAQGISAGCVIDTGS